MYCFTYVIYFCSFGKGYDEATPHFLIRLINDSGMNGINFHTTETSPVPHAPIQTTTTTINVNATSDNAISCIYKCLFSPPTCANLKGRLLTITGALTLLVLVVIWLLVTQHDIFTQTILIFITLSVLGYLAFNILYMPQCNEQHQLTN